MARRPDIRQDDVLTREELKQLQQKLSHVSIASVQEFYRSTRHRCSFQPSYLGQPDWVQRVLAARPDAEMFWTEGGPNINDPHHASDWSKWSSTFSEILRNRLRYIIG